MYLNRKKSIIILIFFKFNFYSLNLNLKLNFFYNFLLKYIVIIIYQNKRYYG